MKDDIRAICAYITFNLTFLGIAYWLTTTQSAKDGIVIVISGLFGAMAPSWGRDFAEEIAEHSKVVSTIFILGHQVLMIYVLFIRGFLWFGNTLTGWAVGGIIGYIVSRIDHNNLYKDD